MRLAVTCAVFAVGTVLIAAEPARSNCSTAPVVQSAKWAAQPSLPTVGLESPAVADPTQYVGETLPERVAECVAEVTIVTIRRCTRTRWGGRCGP